MMMVAAVKNLHLLKKNCKKIKTKGDSKQHCQPDTINPNWRGKAGTFSTLDLNQHAAPLERWWVRRHLIYFLVLWLLTLEEHIGLRGRWYTKITASDLELWIMSRMLLLTCTYMRVFYGSCSLFFTFFRLASLYPAGFWQPWFHSLSDPSFLEDDLVFSIKLVSTTKLSYLLSLDAHTTVDASYPSC